MAYKILYVEDQAAESRAQDMSNIGFEVVTYDPSSDMSLLLKQVDENTKALVLDYRLTAGEKQACFDAPTVAQTFRSKFSHDTQAQFEIPIILMSNESVITDYYNDFTSQDLFDFTLTKKEFINNKERFGNKLIAFIEGYAKIREVEFNISKALGLENGEEQILHNSLEIKTTRFNKHAFEYSQLIFEQIIRSIGPLIGPDLLSARLGVSKSSKNWEELLNELEDSAYKGILSKVYPRWWMSKVNSWWLEKITKEPLRRLDAEHRTQLISEKLKLNLTPLKPTKLSQSSTFWTICKYSHEAIDPFDGVELLKRDLLIWQEKEYLSIDSALTRIEAYKDYISEIDKKALRELSEKLNANA